MAALHYTEVNCTTLYCTYQLLKLPPLRMVLQLENRNCSTNRLIFHILGLLALLPCLVLLILLLVDPLEVVEHAPVVGRLAPGLAPGDDLAA